MIKLLDVKYLAQNDNEDWQGASGYVQCCPTANTMLAAYLLPDFITNSEKNGFAEPESYYKSKMEALGYSANDRGNHDAHTATLRSLGIISYWTTHGTSKDIVKSIDADIPVVIAVEYKSSGHVMIVTGYSSENGGKVFINDSYGIRQGSSNNYSYINPGFSDETGHNDEYSWSLLNHILFDGSYQNGWMRIVTVVNGKPTGLK